MKYTFSILLLMTIVSCKSVHSNYPVVVDLANPTYPSPFTLKPRQSVELTLKNINPELYDVSVKDSFIVRQTEIPPLFTQVFTIPELTEIPKEAPAGDGTKAGAKPSKMLAKIKQKETSLDIELSEYISSYSGNETAAKDVLSLSSIPSDIKKLTQDCYSSIEDIRNKVNTYIHDKMNSVSVSTMPLGIASTVTIQSDDAKKGLNELITSGETLRKKLQSILENADAALKLAEYRSLEKDIKAKIAIIDKVEDNAKKLLEKLKAFDSSKIGEAIEDSYMKVMASRIEKTILIPTQYSTDELIMNVVVKKKGSINCPKEIGSFKVIGIVTGGIKIDFSTGFVLNIGQDKFFDQKFHYDSLYSTKGTSADSVVIARSHNSNVFVPSLGAFLHVYSRFAQPVNIGGMIGASLGSDQRAYLHVGGSVIIGKSDRLIIGGGMSIAKAKVLDGKFHEGEKFKQAYAPTEIPLDDATRVGGFISITWNLGLNK